MRTRPLALLAAALTATLALAGCSAGAPADAGASTTAAASGAGDLTLTTANGDVTLTAEPQKIVVFDFASLDTLDAIGKGDLVVGTATKQLPESLQGFAELPSVGTLKEPDFEAVAALEPDLIIVSARLAEQMPQLEEIAPTVNLAPDSTDWLASSISRAEDLAGVFGLESSIAPQIEKIESTADEIRAAAKDAGPTMVLMTSGGKLSTYGPGSRYGFLYDDLGFTPAIEGGDTANRHGQEVSFELVAEKNPAQLIVIDRDAAVEASGQAASALLDNSLVNSTDAMKNDRVAYVDAVTWYLVGGGVTSTQAMLDEILTAVK